MEVKNGSGITLVKNESRSAISQPNLLGGLGLCERLVRLCLCFSRPLGVDVDSRDTREGSETALFTFSFVSFKPTNSLSDCCFSSGLSSCPSLPIVSLPIILGRIIFKNYGKYIRKKSDIYCVFFLPSRFFRFSQAYAGSSSPVSRCSPYSRYSPFQCPSP